MNCKVRGLRRKREINDSRDDKGKTKIKKMMGEGEDCKIILNEKEIKGPTKTDGGKKAAS